VTDDQHARREQVLRRVERRVEAYAVSQDPASVLDADAGRGSAAGLGEAGATAVCTGRSSVTGRGGPDYDRPETIEETAELVDPVGGVGVAVHVDHRVPDQVRGLADRLRDRYGHIDVLANDI
jgi:NAD(P)-dependent dehydrogenase (short-subunit alcohol dehydrogenase family)